MFFEAIGWIGNVSLALCGVPLAWVAIRTGKSAVNPAFLFLWFGGELLVCAYVVYLGDWALTVNYSVNIMALTVVIKYQFFPRT